MFARLWSKITGSHTTASLEPLPAEMLSKFISAIKKADVEEVQQLVMIAEENKYDLNTYTKMQFTLLHFAINKTQSLKNEDEIMQIIDILHAGGADINKAACDQLKATPLHTACRRGIPAFAEWLLQKGAHPDARDSTGKSPVDYLDRVIEVKRQEQLAAINELERLIATRDVFAKHAAFRNQP